MELSSNEGKRTHNIISDFNPNENILVKNNELIKLKINKIKEMGPSHLSIFTGIIKEILIKH